MGLFDLISWAAHEYSLVGWGDFNCFLSDEERHGSQTNRNLDMEEFNEAVADSGLIDLGCHGDSLHTWVRSGLQERLDRIFVNASWGDKFPKSQVNHLSRVHSDHAPLSMQAFLHLVKPPMAFRYQKMWARNPSFLDIVRQTWEGLTGERGMINLQYKLLKVKQKIRWWNKNIFGNIFDKLKEAKDKVMMAEKLYDSSPNIPNRLALKQAIDELTLATRTKEDFWHQNFHCKWIVVGERNTKYFHSLVKQKRIHSRINSIMDNFLLLSEDAEIQKSGSQFFENHLSNEDGATRGLVNQVGLRGVLRDHNGNILREFFDHAFGCSDSFTAECLARQKGILLLKQHGIY
ncbi:hypothetical protein DH2020_040626 [Rehmannia glutinosa]|uniref:Uncharacterized protein n=1 Tax=Rehmannia glutinosa TaxID=99300 RepID=A0ABR0UTP1_REHGL